MKSSPTVSACIPTRLDRLNYLIDTIQSISSQTHAVGEVLIIASGRSAEQLYINSTSLKARLSSKLSVAFNEKIKIVISETPGLGAARNLGADLTHCDIIVYGDDDDIWNPERVQAIFEQCASSDKPCLVRHSYDILDESFSISSYKKVLLRLIRKQHSTYSHLSYYQAGLSNYFGGGSALSGHAVVFKTVRFDESLQFCEDWDFWLRSMMCGIPVKSLPVALVTYRVHVSRMTSSYTKSFQAEIILRYNILKNLIKLVLGLVLGGIQLSCKYTIKMLLVVLLLLRSSLCSFF